MTATLGLERLAGRCVHGYHIKTQHPDLCACKGLRLRDAGQARATAAHPDERAKVEAAVRHLAATGRPFSANDARLIHGVAGGVVGATFTALRKEGVIRAVGDERSTDAGTHGHRIYQWIGVNTCRNAKGSRLCRICRATESRERKARARGVLAAAPTADTG